MSKTTKIVLAALASFFAIIIAIAGFLFAAYVSIHDKSAGYETRIQGSYDQARIRLGNHENVVMEMFQIDTASRDHARKIVRETMEGRYGPNGSQAVFQMLTEAQIPIDESNRAKIMNAIEAGRNQYMTSQENMISIVTNYRGELNTVWFGTIARIAGFPKIDLNKYKGISTARGDSVFEAGQEEGPLNIYESK